MPDTYDPDERFSIWPLTGEDALKKVRIAILDPCIIVPVVAEN
jgi:hypothetical protein